MELQSTWAKQAEIMGAEAKIVTEQQWFFGTQLPAIEPFTGGENRWSPAKKENPEAVVLTVVCAVTRR